MCRMSLAVGLVYLVREELSARHSHENYHNTTQLRTGGAGDDRDGYGQQQRGRTDGGDHHVLHIHHHRHHQLSYHQVNEIFLGALNDLLLLLRFVLLFVHY